MTNLVRVERFQQIPTVQRKKLDSEKIHPSLEDKLTITKVISRDSLSYQPHRDLVMGMLWQPFVLSCTHSSGHTCAAPCNTPIMTS